MTNLTNKATILGLISRYTAESKMVWWEIGMARLVLDLMRRRSRRLEIRRMRLCFWLTVIGRCSY